MSFKPFSMFTKFFIFFFYLDASMHIGQIVEHFNKKWKRASSIRKIKRKNKLKKMLFIKQKD